MDTYNTNALKQAILTFATMNSPDFEGLSLFRMKQYLKGDYFNITNSVCCNLAFVSIGIFGIFFMTPKKEEEINLLSHRGQLIFNTIL